jgi:ATP-grasp domain
MPLGSMTKAISWAKLLTASCRRAAKRSKPASYSLKLARLLDGYRGAARGDWPALVGSVESIAHYAVAHRDTLIELDVNPLLVFATGSGAVAVDALIRLSEEVL